MTLVNDENELSIVVEEDTAWIMGSRPMSNILVVNRSNSKTFRKISIPRTIVHGLATGPSNRLINGARDHTLRSWDPATEDVSIKHEAFAAPVQLVIANETSPVYGVVTAYSALHTESWQQPIKSPIVIQHRSKIGSACSSEDGRLVTTGCIDGDVQIWDTNNRERIGGPMTHASPMTAISISPDSRIVFTGAGTAPRTWEIPNPGPEPLDEIATRTELLTGIHDRERRTGSLDYGRKIKPHTQSSAVHFPLRNLP